MRTFIPAEPHTRVTFAASGQHEIVVVEEAGITVDDESEDGDTSLLATLEAHPFLTEVGAPAHGKKGESPDASWTDENHPDDPALD